MDKIGLNTTSNVPTFKRSTDEEVVAMKRSHKWITQNFEELVSKYGGKYIRVVGEEVIASALTPKEVMQKAKDVVRMEEVSLLKVPTEEELICIL